MSEKKGQEMILTDLKCRNCGNRIVGQPYIRDGKFYCHLCKDRAKIGLFDHIGEQHYKGRIYM
ncbi:MAG: hypothetical protein U9R14_03320 [Patescibacteria group bacterium]|nr:hypothetical protein [Patescibacteria group bacterium]